MAALSKYSTQQYQNYGVSPQKPGHPEISRILRMTHDIDSYFESTHILLMNLSLLTGLPFFPPDTFGVSVHISFTFSNTMLQCLSNAFTLARSFRLLRQEMRTWVCERTAVCRIERGPEVNSCSSRTEISYSLQAISTKLEADAVRQGSSKGDGTAE